MKCPNCHLEQPDNSATCPGCGVIFEKWKAHHPEPGSAPAVIPPVTPATPPPAAEPVPPESASPPTPETAPEEDDRYNLSAIHYLGILTFIGLTIFYFYTPAKPVKSHQAAAEEGNPAPADNSTLNQSATASPTSTASPLNTPLAVVPLPTNTPIPVPETTNPNPASNTAPATSTYHY